MTFPYYDEAKVLRDARDRWLEPPAEVPDFCKECGDEKPCTTCIRCSWCEETKDDCTGDCETGHSAKCDRSRRYVDGALKRIGCNCIAVWEEHEARFEEHRARAKARAEELHMEEGLDDAREARG